MRNLDSKIRLPGTQQVQLALSSDGQLDVEAFEHMRALGGGDETSN
jgi:hypothetical protein